MWKHPRNVGAQVSTCKARVCCGIACLTVWSGALGPVRSRDCTAGSILVGTALGGVGSVRTVTSPYHCGKIQIQGSAVPGLSVWFPFEIFLLC